jgi:hypothetical protein
MAGERAATLRKFTRGKAENVLHKAAKAGGEHTPAKVTVSGHGIRKTMAGPKTRAAGTARKFGGELEKAGPLK